MTIQQYVISHWDELPKSSFNKQECVVIKEIRNEDYGWGHHDYEGYAMDQSGNLLWCYSSGCSCNGSCGADHAKDAKVFETEWTEDFTRIDPATVNFPQMQVTFEDY